MKERAQMAELLAQKEREAEQALSRERALQEQLRAAGIDPIH